MKTEVKGFIITIFGLCIVILLSYTVFKEQHSYLPNHSVSYTYEIQEGSRKSKETEDWLQIENKFFAIYDHQTKELLHFTYENPNGIYQIQPQFIYQNKTNWKKLINKPDQKMGVGKILTYPVDNVSRVKTFANQKFQNVTVKSQENHSIYYGKETFMISEKQPGKERTLTNTESLWNIDDYLNEKFLQCSSKKQVVYQLDLDPKKIAVVPKDRFDDLRWDMLTNLEKTTARCQFKK